MGYVSVHHLNGSSRVLRKTVNIVEKLTWIDRADPLGSGLFILVLVVAAALWRRGRRSSPSTRRGRDDRPVGRRGAGRKALWRYDVLQRGA